MGDGVIAGRTGGRNHHGLARKSKLRRHMTGHYVTWIAGDELCPHFFQLSLDVMIVEALDEMRLSRSGACTNSHALQIGRRQVEVRIGYRQPRRRDG